MSSKSHPFVLYPVKCTPAFRQTVIRLYPALTRHPDAPKFWRMLQLLLFSTSIERETGNLIMTHETIAAACECHPKSSKFGSGDSLELFATEMFPLTIHPHKFREGKARTIELNFPKELQNALILDRQAIQSLPPKSRIFFESGEPFTRRIEQAAGKPFCDAMNRSLVLAPEHPAARICEWLNAAPQHKLGSILRSNWAQVEQMTEALPEATAKEYRKKEYSRRLVRQIAALLEGKANGVPLRLIFYKYVETCPRIFAANANIIQLPRALRKAALQGGMELDQRSCHLAIAAKLLNLPHLQTALGQCLQKNCSIWSLFLHNLGLTDEDKTLIKIATISLMYGMSARRVRTSLAEGEGGQFGLGETVAKAYMQHPIIVELSTAQKRKFEEIRAQGGATDAHGRWMECDPTKKNPEASVWARVQQSYEFELMSAIIPIIDRSRRKIHLLAWIHDGVVIHVSDPVRRTTTFRKMKEAFDAKAAAFGFLTTLEYQ